MGGRRRLTADLRRPPSAWDVAPVRFLPSPRKPRQHVSLWSELKRRRVIKVGVAYLIVSLAVGEGADIFLPQLGAPSWVVPVILALLALGLPVALVLRGRTT